VKARQCHYTLRSTAKTFPMFRDQWGLVGYRTQSEPAVFFGCYNDTDRQRIASHRGPAIVVWLGSDFVLQGLGHESPWLNPNVYHVAVGPWLASDMEAVGYRYRRVNLIGSPLVSRIKPEPLGDAVYCYLPKRRYKDYGGPLFDEVRALCPDVYFIVQDGLEVAQEAMPSIYRRCFLGLRLAPHDGGSEGVVEMGLMGRRSMHNGDTPASIPYETAEDIAKTIRAFSDNLRGRTLFGTAKAVREYIATDDGWLDVDGPFWSEQKGEEHGKGIHAPRC